MHALRELVVAVLLLPFPQDAKKPESAREVERAFLEHQIHLDLARRLCWIPSTIDIREDLLEYLLVNPRGAAHESLLVTEVVPSRLNAALLALGVVPGTNAKWKPKDPPPTPDEVRDGAPPYVVEPPNGDGFFLYAAWREGGDTHFHRIDDLLRNLESGRSMRRHRWVFLGSRMVKMRAAEGATKEMFAADVEGNLVNIALFEEGNTLATAALPECLKQTIWLANGWLLPERGAPVVLIFSHEELASLPPEMESGLPEVPDGGTGR